ncbi:MAG: hypothetical protein CL678_05125 [Bdellovibrionaceae bacterium]|nr:hypothetical protein [Pseudobdellovibrionaceae bacterium]|tara:strand:+ start:8960 stop:10363 length:1404 start_codon:yes stop_codon:yes gene_type:complete
MKFLSACFLVIFFLSGLTSFSQGNPIEDHRLTILLRLEKRIQTVLAELREKVSDPKAYKKRLKTILNERVTELNKAYSSKASYSRISSLEIDVSQAKRRIRRFRKSIREFRADIKKYELRLVLVRKEIEKVKQNPLNRDLLPSIPSKDEKSEASYSEQDCSIQYQVYSELSSQADEIEKFKNNGVFKRKHLLEKQVKSRLTQWLRSMESNRSIDSYLRNTKPSSEATQVDCAQKLTIFENRIQKNPNSFSESQLKDHLSHYLKRVGNSYSARNNYLHVEDVNLSFLDHWNKTKDGYQYVQACSEVKEEWELIKTYVLSIVEIDKKWSVQLCLNQFAGNLGVYYYEIDENDVRVSACATKEIKKKHSQIEIVGVIETPSQLIEENVRPLSLNEFYSVAPMCEDWAPKSEVNFDKTNQIEDAAEPLKVGERLSGKSCRSNEWELEASRHCKVKGIYKTQSDLDLGVKKR